MNNSGYMNAMNQIGAPVQFAPHNPNMVGLPPLNPQAKGFRNTNNLSNAAEETIDATHMPASH